MKLWQIEDMVLGEELEKDALENLKCYSADSLKAVAGQYAIKDATKEELVVLLEKRFRNKRSLDKMLSALQHSDLAILKIAAELPDEKRTILNIVRMACLRGIESSFSRTIDLIKKGLLIVWWYKNTGEVFKLEDLEKAARILKVFVLPAVYKAVVEIEVGSVVFEPAFPARTLSGTHLDPSMLLHEYYVVMRHLYHQPAEIIKSGRIKAAYIRRCLKRINLLISAIDEKQFEYMLMLLETGGMLVRNNETMRLALSEQGEQWFELSPLKQLKQLFLATSGNNFNFLALDYYAKIHSDIFMTHAGNITVDKARLDVVSDWCYLPEILAVVPQDNFVKLSEVISHAGNGYPYLFFDYYDGLKETVSKPELTEEQQRIQKIIFTGYIEEIATPMGLVEWAIGKKSGELLIRLTSLGAYFLGLKEESELDYGAASEHGPAIVVQPDFDVLVFLDKVSLEESLFLLNICSTTYEQAAQSPVRRLHLNNDSIKWAIEDKMDQASIMELLKRLSLDTVPQNVTVELNEWIGGGFPVELYRGHDLLEFSTQAERDSALNKKKNSVAVSKRFLLVPTKETREKSLVDYSGPSPKELKITALGAITRNLSGPKSLETLKLLDELAERISENSWQLSTEMLMKSSRSSKRIVEFFEETSESLPPSVYAMIKGCLDSKTELKSAKMEIVEVMDQRLLKGLIEHEATRDLIAGNIGPNHLAIYSENVVKFWKMVRTLGMVKSKAQLATLPKTTGRLSNDKRAGDLSGFCMVNGNEKKQRLVNAINNGWDVELLILESSLSYYYSRSKIDIVKGTPLGFEGEAENYLRLKTEKNGHVAIVKLQTIKAVRDIL